MTPKEKAYELIEKFDGYTHYAEYAVDEILFIVSKYNDTQVENAYWQEVKKEIEN
jgi:hypothetical protein